MQKCVEVFVTHNFSIPITGQVHQITPFADTMTFQGSASHGWGSTESVNFNGLVSEANDVNHVLLGTLDQVFSDLGGTQHTTSHFSSYGFLSSYWIS